MCAASVRQGRDVLILGASRLCAFGHGGTLSRRAPRVPGHGRSKGSDKKAAQPQGPVDMHAGLVIGLVPRARSQG
jgi:hypothetical protein